jgi:hypothetical protein
VPRRCMVRSIIKPLNDAEEKQKELYNADWALSGILDDESPTEEAASLCHQLVHVNVCLES